MKTTTKKRILQHYICPNHYNNNAYLVLIEFENDIPILTYTVPIPPTFKFCNSDYQYFTINPN
jgi:hypothetical protein